MYRHNNIYFEYNKLDSLLLKGLAIIAIVFHNYYHWLYQKTKENEFWFQPENFSNYIKAIIESPSELVHASFTYFGHLGVTVFIFISAYGLGKSYPKVNVYSDFIRSRISKIYLPLLIAIAFWLILFGRQGGFMGPYYFLLDNAESVSYLLLGVSNIIPGNEMKPVGPWWFIPFIIQFYLIYPLISRAMSWSQSVPLILFFTGIVINVIVNPIVVKSYGINLYFTPLGHLPEICLGIYASKNKFELTNTLLMLTLIIFLLSNISEYWWALHNVSALAISLWLFHYIKNMCKYLHQLRLVLMICGQLSLGLFLINGFLRGGFVGSALQYQSLLMEHLFALANFITCIIGAYLLTRVEVYLRKIYSKVLD